MPRLIPLFDVTPIMANLAAGQLILTPNQRLASRISTAYAIACQQADQAVVAAPEVYSLDVWVQSLWQQLLQQGDSLANGTVLGNVQELLLWEQLVSESERGALLLRPAETARQAASAYQLLIQWQVLRKASPAQPSVLSAETSIAGQGLGTLFRNDEDASCLLEWARSFEQKCAENDWIASAHLAGYCHNAFAEGRLVSPGAILGIGFEDLAPLHQQLLASAGEFTRHDDSATAASVKVIECESSKQELLAAAVWAKQQLKNDADAVVAVVIPDLTNQRQIVERVFQQVFDPDFVTIAADTKLPGRKNLPFNLSAGYPLVQAPLIKAALDILSLANRELAIETYTSICQSPFYCLDETDNDYIAALLTAVYEQQDPQLSVARFRRLAEQVGEAADWPFIAILQQLAQSLRSSVTQKSAPLTVWSELFQEVLAKVGWPGRRALDSIEYQQFMQWQKSLTLFEGLQTVSGDSNFFAALSTLQGVLAQQIFQAQSADSPLQVLGTLEAAGLRFTHLWLASQSEKQWPPAPAPHALIPTAVQRGLTMPHATAERELRYAQNLGQRFLHSADNLVISYPAIIDNNPVAVSRLYADYPQYSIDQLLGRALSSLNPVDEIRRRGFRSGQLESFDPGNAPALQQEETVKGGISVFTSQSACPFKAFVSHRLGIKALPVPQLGLSPGERGSLLHRALELVWKKLQSHSDLLALDEDGVQQLAHEAVSYAVDGLSKKNRWLAGQRFNRLEKDRLSKLVSAWLQIEKGRVPFTIDAVEAESHFNFKTLSIRSRIDRMDRLADNSLVIIDYKSGETSSNAWWGVRPDEPQLPLYSHIASRSGEQVSGVAFAQLKRSRQALKGVGSEDNPEPLLAWNDKHRNDSGALNWEQLQLQWTRVLETLAEDFIAGDARVDPKNPVKSCQYCDYASVCRVDFQSRLLTDELESRGGQSQ